MSATTFGAPMDDMQDTAAIPGLDVVQEAAIDLDDPRLTSENLDVNLEGDAYAFPAPPPDGKYRVKLKVMKVKNAQGAELDYLPKMHESGPYLFTALDATILDPTGKYDGIHSYDRWVGTFISKRDKSTKVQTILKLLHKPDGTSWITPGMALSHRPWMELFQKALAGEPEIGIETQWEWNCQACGEEAKKKGEGYPRDVKGMNKFPMDAEASKKAGKPVYSSEMKCQVNPAHGFSRAKVAIARFIPLSEVR